MRVLLSTREAPFAPDHQSGITYANKKGSPSVEHAAHARMGKGEDTDTLKRVFRLKCVHLPKQKPFQENSFSKTSKNRKPVSGISHEWITACARKGSRGRDWESGIVVPLFRKD
jgi:hypothetical protein